MKKLLQSNYFYMLVLSIGALLLSIIEYVVILLATEYFYIPMLIGMMIFIGLFIYTFTFRKNQSSYLLLILVFIISWMLSLFFMGNKVSYHVGENVISVGKDKIFCLKYIFPGILMDYIYEYNSLNETLGSLKGYQLRGLDVNLLVSLIMVIVTSVIFVLKRKKETQNNSLYEPSGSLKNSPYLLMMLVSIFALVLSSIETIFLTYASLTALIVMIIGAILFVCAFTYILASEKKKNMYNFLILAFIFIWVLFIAKYFKFSMGQVNNGREYYRLGFMFPCLITNTCYDFFTDEIISTRVIYGYINWLFSFIMVIVTSLIFFYKEKLIGKNRLKNK